MPARSKVRVAATLIGGAVGVSMWMPASASADPGDPTSRHRVHAAAEAVDSQQGEISNLQAKLAVARHQLRDVQDQAEQAAEADNGAKYAVQQAASAARTARQQSVSASATLESARQSYADAVTYAYEMSPELGSLGAISGADGIGTVMEQTAAAHNAQAALQTHYDAFNAASAAATSAVRDAHDSLDAARSARSRARDTSQSAASAEADAAQQAATYAASRDQMVAQLAQLQHVSVTLAARRQDQLEQQAEAAAAAAAQALAEQQAAQQLADQQAKQQAHDEAVASASASAASASAAAASSAAASQSALASASPRPTRSASHTATPTPTATVTPTATSSATSTATPTSVPTTTTTATTTAPTATPTTVPTTPPTTTPTTPPAPSTGAAAAIAFATAQIGKPYVYGSAGPSSFDCSGLTMKAWAAGGVTLPHYSVAQYESATPLTLDQLAPGDLLFWSSNGKASGIYHVALYLGGGQMIEAPHPGATVHQVSMYSWRAPNLFARA